MQPRTPPLACAADPYRRPVPPIRTTDAHPGLCRPHAPLTRTADPVRPTRTADTYRQPTTNTRCHSSGCRTCTAARNTHLSNTIPLRPTPQHPPRNTHPCNTIPVKPTPQHPPLQHDPRNTHLATPTPATPPPQHPHPPHTLGMLPVPQTESVKYTRRNENVRPFEVGGEASLEFYARKGGCGLFALGSHSKKRPHNLVLGRCGSVCMGLRGRVPFAALAS
eukprot:59369-Chlamydomonas_euryale.AAC.2